MEQRSSKVLFIEVMLTALQDGGADKVGGDELLRFYQIQTAFTGTAKQVGPPPSNWQ